MANATFDGIACGFPGITNYVNPAIWDYIKGKANEAAVYAGAAELTLCKLSGPLWVPCLVQAGVAFMAVWNSAAIYQEARFANACHA